MNAQTRKQRREVKGLVTKQMRALCRELRLLERRIRDSEVIALDEPYQRGWVRYFVWSEEAMRRKDFAVMEGLLEHMQHRQWSRRRDFIASKRRCRRVEMGWKPTLSFHPHELLRICRDSNWPKYFAINSYCPVKSLDHLRALRAGGWNGKVCFMYPHLLRPHVEPYFVTHRKIRDSAAESRIAEIEAWIGRHGGWSVMLRALEARSWPDCNDRRKKLRLVNQREVTQELEKRGIFRAFRFLGFGIERRLARVGYDYLIMMKPAPRVLAWIAVFCMTAATAAEVVRYRDFGAKGDGKTDDFAAIAKAHEHANEKGLPVQAEDGATYYIGGADMTISIETPVNFGKAKFIIDDTKVENHRANVFQVRSKQKAIRLKEVESLKKGQERLDVKLPGPCLVAVRDDSVKRFIRRGKNQNDGSPQTDVFLVDAQGKVDPTTPIIWDFKKLSRIEAMPIDKEVLLIRGGHFTTIANQAKSEYNYHARGIAIRRSNVRIEGIEHRVEGEGETGAPYQGFINVSNCANVVVKDTVLTGRKTYGTDARGGGRVSMGSYDVHLSSAVNVALVNVTQTNDIMDRKYWGIIGTNFCKNLSYDGCKLSRFDAHQGVTNATIRNSTLGHMGLRLTGFGTFTIENSAVEASAFISLREDYGSTWNGDVIIRNCRFIPTSAKPAIISGSNDGKHDFGYTCHLPTRVIIDGLRIEDGKLGKGYQGPLIFSNTNPGYKKGAKLPFPQAITREVAYRGVVAESGKALRLSDNQDLFAGVKVLAPEAKQ